MRISETPEWKALADHQRTLRDVHLRELFADDADRGRTVTCTSTTRRTG
jgi:glucose-6-phosphate isomerase